MRSYRATLALAWCVVASTVSAAPPKVDYLFPAGGQRGTTVIVTASGTFERWPVKAWCESKDVTIKSGKTSGQLSITIAAEAEPGVTWIRLYDDQGTSVPRPFFVGILPEVLEKEPNDDPRKPHLLEQSSVVANGRLDKQNEVDTYAIQLTKGQTLVASLEANRTLRSPMDGVLQILSADAFVLEQNDDYHGLDPQIAFTAPKDGVYLARVFAFPDKADSSIRFAGKDSYVYRLTLTTGPFVEYAYPLAIASSKSSTVDLAGWNVPNELRRLTMKPNGRERLVRVTPPSIATPSFVRVENGAAMVKTKATRAEPQKIMPPVTITGKLEQRGDIDVYQFEAKKGQKVPIRIKGRTLGFPIDPVLRVTDAAGKSIQQSQAKAIGTDPTLDFAPTADGTYRLEVRDLAGGGGMRYVYLLNIGNASPDFDLKVAADSFTLTAAKSLDIPVTVERRDGFKEEVVLSVEGLPKDVKMTATAKAITLQLTEKNAFSGPIRIVGTAKDGTVRHARATVAELARTNEHLWLTTIAK
jgi:hypothetical protein